ncbi:Prepilin-type cleavage/methylation protein [Candidatus Saccharibacteria bacterium RAAC3_TM7_1]|nr:Prepilin-type cleavage/methylation protein [Candidatus Saccharibacteria bacterium RAAC3_TM7_1]
MSGNELLPARNRRPGGFTIVELLIVIVVIAILAAITIVAYNGIQTRAKNTKTINATAAWIKALRLYEADNGDYPTVTSCLGTTTTYPDNTQCWNNASWTVKSSFLTLMQPYLSSFPEPDTTNIDTVNTPRRGALYTISGAVKYVYMSLIGVTSCPTMSIPTYSGGNTDQGRYCIYQLN